jgi:NADPH-dependent ferric siderophore reductase
LTVATAPALRTFLTEVVDVRDVGPRIRQISFGGLDHFPSLGADQFVWVLLPPPGRAELTIDADFSWDSVPAMPEADRPAGAYYSVRSWWPDLGELDVWFVLHGGGDATRWAATAQPGDPAAVWGPRRLFDPPADTDSYLVAVDETGYGAAAAIVDHLLCVDEDAPVTVVAECGRKGEEIALPTGPNVDLHWVSRNGAPPGSTAVLLETVRSLPLSSRVYAYCVSERGWITALREHLRTDRSLPTEQVRATGYWRR